MNNLKHNRLMLILAGCLASQIVFSQAITFPSLPGFRLKTNYPVYTADNLWDFIDGAADAYLTYGFKDVHVAGYNKGKESIKAEIYRLGNHTMAFGIYSSERSSDFNFTKTGAQGYMTGGSLNFFKGDFYVKIRTFSRKPSTLQATRNLALRIEGILEGSTAMPDVLALFPGEGKKENSETFINENVLGHGFLSNAFRADYQIGTDDFSIFIIQNPSSEISRQTVETYMAATGIDAKETGEDKYILSDGYNGKVFIAWKGNMVVIISGLAPDQADIAGKYTSEILK